MSKRVFVIIAIFVTAIFSWVFATGSTSFRIINNNSMPEFWGGASWKMSCADCYQVKSACETMAGCNTYNNQSTSCAIYWQVVKANTGKSPESGGYNSATVYNWGKCADTYDCIYDTTTGRCSQSSDLNDVEWYLSCGETT